MLENNFKKILWFLFTFIVSTSVFAEKSGIELSKEITSLKANTALLKAQLEHKKTLKALNSLDEPSNKVSNANTRNNSSPSMGAVSMPYTLNSPISGNNNSSLGMPYGLNQVTKKTQSSDSYYPEPIVILIEGPEDNLTATLLVGSGTTKPVRTGDVIGKWKIKSITANGVESETLKDKKTVFFSFGDASYQFSSNSDQ